jgi:hypothetical protein
MCLSILSPASPGLVTWRRFGWGLQTPVRGAAFASIDEPAGRAIPGSAWGRPPSRVLGLWKPWACAASLSVSQP